MGSLDVACQLQGFGVSRNLCPFLTYGFYSSEPECGHFLCGVGWGWGRDLLPTSCFPLPSISHAALLVDLSGDGLGQFSALRDVCGQVQAHLHI